MSERRKISIDTVQHIASLAHLELTAEEEEMYSYQLADILEYIDQLNALDTEDIPPTYHAIDLKDAFRDDSPTDQSISTEEGLKNAPLSGDRFFKVPKIIGSKADE